MRLTGSEGGGRIPPSTALLGMRLTAPIPCCDDIYGAFEKDSSSGHPDDGSVYVTHRGLTLVRPFLGYAKARLQATCESMEVHYVTDTTNLDPTSTRRNTIRHLLTTHKLPRALRRSSLLQSQVRIREKVLTSVEVHGTALWGLLKVQNFDVRSGSLSIQFPERPKLGSEEDCFTSIGYVLTDLLDAVSPKPRGSIAVSADIIESVIEALFQGTNEHQMSCKSFVETVAGVLVEPSQRVLRLSREPVRGTEKSKLMKAFVVASQADSIEGQSWTEWLFWDHRYWLRIKLGPSENADDYAVRAYTEADVVSAYTRLRKVSWKAMESFKILLESAATGKTKFTLPVITKAGLVICFPTLNIILPDAAGHNWGENYLPGILWQIRYKSQAPLLRLACLRNGINLSNAGGLARKHEGLSRDAGWESIPDP
jgi:tRNA(Ile)-lysidine synthase